MFRLALAAAAASMLSSCAYFFPSCQTVPACPSGQIMCSDAGCSNLHGDALNCGACNNVCAAGLVCRDASDGGAFCGCSAPGSEVVNGQCVDVLTDDANCGQPGRACPTGEVCLDGGCGCPGSKLGSLVLCVFDGGQACVNLVTDDYNCGSCGAACDPAANCQSGACVCLDGTPQCGAACCAGSCVGGACLTDGGTGEDAGPDGGVGGDF